MDQHWNWKTYIQWGLHRVICLLHGHLCQHRISADKQPEVWGHSYVLLCKAQCENHILRVSETLREKLLLPN
jgi:hypothetical protein